MWSVRYDVCQCATLTAGTGGVVGGQSRRKSIRQERNKVRPLRNKVRP